MTVEGVGRYVMAVPRDSVLHARATFKAKGGGQIIALFAAQPSVWFKVAEVRASLCLQGVILSRETVRGALNHLVEMGFLEMPAKMVVSEKVSPQMGLYRRLLNPAQRERMESSALVTPSAPLAKAMREKRRQRNAQRHADTRRVRSA